MWQGASGGVPMVAPGDHTSAARTEVGASPVFGDVNTAGANNGSTQLITSQLLLNQSTALRHTPEPREPLKQSLGNSVASAFVPFNSALSNAKVAKPAPTPPPNQAQVPVPATSSGQGSHQAAVSESSVPVIQAAVVPQRRGKTMWGSDTSSSSSVTQDKDSEEDSESETPSEAEEKETPASQCPTPDEFPKAVQDGTVLARPVVEAPHVLRTKDNACVQPIDTPLASSDGASAGYQGDSEESSERVDVAMVTHNPKPPKLTSLATVGNRRQSFVDMTGQDSSPMALAATLANDTTANNATANAIAHNPDRYEDQSGQNAGREESQIWKTSSAQNETLEYSASRDHISLPPSLQQQSHQDVQLDQRIVIGGSVSSPANNFNDYQSFRSSVYGLAAGQSQIQQLHQPSIQSPKPVFNSAISPSGSLPFHILDTKHVQPYVAGTPAAPHVSNVPERPQQTTASLPANSTVQAPQVQQQESKPQQQQQQQQQQPSHHHYHHQQQHGLPGGGIIQTSSSQVMPQTWFRVVPPPPVTPTEMRSTPRVAPLPISMEHTVGIVMPGPTTATLPTPEDSTPGRQLFYNSTGGGSNNMTSPNGSFMLHRGVSSELFGQPLELANQQANQILLAHQADCDHIMAGRRIMSLGQSNAPPAQAYGAQVPYQQYCTGHSPYAAAGMANLLTPKDVNGDQSFFQANVPATQLRSQRTGGEAQTRLPGAPAHPAAFLPGNSVPLMIQPGGEVNGQLTGLFSASRTAAAYPLLAAAGGAVQSLQNTIPAGTTSIHLSQLQAASEAYSTNIRASTSSTAVAASYTYQADTATNVAASQLSPQDVGQQLVTPKKTLKARARRAAAVKRKAKSPHDGAAASSNTTSASGGVDSVPQPTTAVAGRGSSARQKAVYTPPPEICPMHGRSQSQSQRRRGTQRPSAKGLTKFRCLQCTAVLDHQLREYGPEPSQAQKEELLKMVGMTRNQITYWFSNKRRHIRKRLTLADGGIKQPAIKPPPRGITSMPGGSLEYTNASTCSNASLTSVSLHPGVNSVSTWSAPRPDVLASSTASFGVAQGGSAAPGMPRNPPASAASVDVRPSSLLPSTYLPRRELEDDGKWQQHSQAEANQCQPDQHRQEQQGTRVHEVAQQEQQQLPLLVPVARLSRGETNEDQASAAGSNTSSSSSSPMVCNHSLDHSNGKQPAVSPRGSQRNDSPRPVATIQQGCSNYDQSPIVTSSCTVTAESADPLVGILKESDLAVAIEVAPNGGNSNAAL